MSCAASRSATGSAPTTDRSAATLGLCRGISRAMVDISTVSEQEVGVLSRAAGGDEIAFARIVAAHHVDMRRVSFVICGDRDMAEDAVQQAWQVAWRKLATIREPNRLRSWLVAVAANETRQLLRRRRRHPEVELELGWHAGLGSVPEPDARHVDLGRALAHLSTEERALLAMRYVAGLNASEISAVVGGSASAVRSRLARLLARLREELTDV
jgi:RNA polymerase sigma-70 factor, ECF subfamily